MISVIICTRNRCDLLADCLDSLVNQQGDFEYEIIVVDNNSEDDTPQIVDKFASDCDIKLKYFKEQCIGLSYARNTGFKNAKFDWVAYVDDDAKAHKNFVQVACETILEGGFDCFGGIYNGWFKYGQPDWLPEKFGSNRERMPVKKSILETLCFSGGVAVYKKKLLEQVGGFPLDIGMRGEIVDYGEENYVQDKAREMGCIVGFTPELQIDHLVRKDKLSKEWHYQEAFKQGKSKARLQKDKRINQTILWRGFLEFFKYPIRVLFSGSTFVGNRNINYFFGYLKGMKES